MRPEPLAAARRLPATNRAPNRAGVRCVGCRRLSLVDEKLATASIRSQVDQADRNCVQSYRPIARILRKAVMPARSDASPGSAATSIKAGTARYQGIKLTSPNLA